MPFVRGWFDRGGAGMGRGMGLGFGRGMGRSIGRGMGMGRGRGLGYGHGMGMGRGNPYPFCRFNPSLPRRWWARGGGYSPAVQPGAYSWNPYYEPQAPYPW